MSINTKFYLDIFVDDVNNKNILISIDMINNVQNYFNITNLTEKEDNILIFIKNESNAYSIIKELNIFLNSLSYYDKDTTSSITEEIYVFPDPNSNGTFNSNTNVKLKGVNKDDIVNYISDTNNIELLVNEIDNNKLLTSEYKSIIQSSIDKILLEKKYKIKVSDTDSYIYNFDDISSIIPYFSLNEGLIESDKQFFTFLNHILYIGVNHILNNNESQLLMSKYSLDNQIYMESINYALNSEITYTDQYYFTLVSYINELFQYAVPFLIDYKNKILMNGYPTYWITYATIIRLFEDKKSLLQKIAIYDQNNLFYQADTLASSKLF